MDYENETRAAYRSPERAAAYKRYHTTDRSWALIATRLEQRLIRRMLRAHDWSAADTMLDVPCGTGILGPTVARVPASIVASDISAEMMALAATEYDAGRFSGFVQADISAMPFHDGRFTAVLTLGFMHRVPEEVRRRALAELYRVCRDIAIVSFSCSSSAQRLKHAILRSIKSGHIPAPCAIPRARVEQEIRDAGFQIVKRASVAPLLSAESLYLLHKGGPS